MKHLNTYRLILLLISMMFVLRVHASLEKYSNEDYNFILLIVSPNSESGLAGIVFSLNDLKVCRFPNGPMWSNSTSFQDSYLISHEAYQNIQKNAKKLQLLCLDFNIFKNQCQNDCQQSVCGFALPWESEMAYVFDDLREIDQVSGLLIKKTQLAKLELGEPFKIDNNSLDDSMNLDEIDLLVVGNTDEEYVGKYLPYPFQDIKNFFGKIVISCLMRYHAIRKEMIVLLGRYDARSKT